ncbi:MAG: hypothetical protein ACFFDT_40445, partial [Candidatus Hodarchaeota archaeon]
EILVFDLDGNLIKKIKKEHRPGNQPPFQCLFFIDDDGRLFIMTFEKGENPKECIFDIFNSDGVLVARKSLDVYVRNGTLIQPLYAQSKNNRLYCLREKESGFKELVVYIMKWE